MKVIILTGGFDVNVDTHSRQSAALNSVIKMLKAIPAITEIVLIADKATYPAHLRSFERHGKSIHIIESNGKRTELGRMYQGLKAKQSGASGYLVISPERLSQASISHFLLGCLGHKSSAIIGVCNLKDRSLATGQDAVLMNEEGRILGSDRESSSLASRVVSFGLYYFPHRFLLRIYQYCRIEYPDSERIAAFIDWLSKKETLYAFEVDGCSKRYEKYQTSVEAQWS